MDYDAIVIGAGPAGSSTAFALAQLGRAVAIVEKSEFPRRKVCGEFLSATNLSLLARFGLDKTWRAEAGPEVRRVGLFAAGSRIEAPMPRSPDGGYGRALGRDRLDGLLLKMAGEAGAVVFQPWQAVRATAEGDVQALRIVSGREEMSLRAPVVIGAHGSWEPGKLQSQLERTFKSSDLFGFKAHFTSAQMEADLMPLLLFPGGYGGMVWSDRGHLSVSCCIRRDMLAELRKAPGCSLPERRFKGMSWQAAEGSQIPLKALRSKETGLPQVQFAQVFVRAMPMTFSASAMRQEKHIR